MLFILLVAMIGGVIWYNTNPEYIDLGVFPLDSASKPTTLHQQLAEQLWT